MNLSAIILRFEGVVADTSEIYRQCLNTVLAEAGFERTVSATTFAKIFGHTVNRERFFEFAEQNLHPRKQTDDLRTLFKVTYKRLSASVSRELSANNLQFGEHVLPLLEAARDSGVPTILLSAQPESTTEHILRAMPGRPPHAIFDAIISGDFESETARTATISRAANLSICTKGNPIVIEACGSGLAAAEAAGLPAIAVIGPAALNGGLYGALAIVDRLHDLIADRPGVAHLSTGEHLLSELKALAANFRTSKRHQQDPAMQVSHILKNKGSTVKSTAPGDSVQFLVKRLSEEKVGAMVVLSRDGVLEGIVSERDVAEGLSVYGCDLLKMPVSNIMTRAVITCSPNDSLLGVAKVMSKRRIRHLPVSEGGKLIGLISIGDVLGQRLEEVELEANVLRDLAITLK